MANALKYGSVHLHTTPFILRRSAAGPVIIAFHASGLRAELEDWYLAHPGHQESGPDSAYGDRKTEKGRHQSVGIGIRHPLAASRNQEDNGIGKEYIGHFFLPCSGRHFEVARTEYF